MHVQLGQGSQVSATQAAYEKVRITVAIELSFRSGHACSISRQARKSRYHKRIYRNGCPPPRNHTQQGVAILDHGQPGLPRSHLHADRRLVPSLARSHAPSPPPNPNPHTPPLPSLAHALSLFPPPPTLFSSRRAELTLGAAELTPVTRPRRHRSGCTHRHDRVRAALRFGRRATR